MRRWFRASAPGYLVAVVATAAVGALRLALGDVLGDVAPFIPFALAVIVAAGYRGLGPGLLATALSALTYVYFVFPHHEPAHLQVAEKIGLAIFVAVGVTASWLCEVMHETQRRLEAEQGKLKESDRFHQIIADLTSDFAFGARIETDNAVVVDSLSEGFGKLLGYTLDEVNARGGWRSVVRADDHSKVEASIARLVAGETAEDQIRTITIDGRELWLRYRVRPLHDAQGRVVRLYGAAEDVSRERAAAEAQHASEERERATFQQLQIVTDTMSVPVTRCSRDLRYLWVSGTYAAWLRRAPDEIIGRPIIEIIGPSAFERLAPHFARVLAGERVTYEDEVDFLNLGRRWISAVYTPTLAPSGVADGWVAVVIDIDERKRREDALREGGRRKDEFLATLAHELRNPLAPIRSAVEVLRAKGARAADLHAARDIIDRQVQQMVVLIKDLLDVGRMSRNTLKARKEQVELATVLENAIETSRPVIDAARHELTVTLPAVPIYLHADRVRLAQVFSNLLNNAATYTDSGGHIWLTVEPRGPEVLISARDTGIGIAAEHLPHHSASPRNLGYA